MTSIALPGVWHGSPLAARTLARAVNDYAAQMVRDHPGRFGLLAALPLPDPDGSLAEIDGGLTESEWVSQVIGQPVIKAFNNIAAQSLATRGVPPGTSGRICIPVAGDDPEPNRL